MLIKGGGQNVQMHFITVTVSIFIQIITGLIPLVLPLLLTERIRYMYMQIPAVNRSTAKSLVPFYFISEMKTIILGQQPFCVVLTQLTACAGRDFGITHVMILTATYQVR